MIIGIDPGISGGLAILDGKKATVTPMPKTERGVWDWFDRLPIIPTKAIIEQVHAFQSQGVTSCFTFGQGYGGLRMALTASYIPFEVVSPMKWQATLGIPSRKKGKIKLVALKAGKNKGQLRKKEVGGESKDEFKKRLLHFAQRLFPKVQLSLKTCDALLLAYYLQLQEAK